MTGSQSRIGDITDAAARALALADQIATGKKDGPEFLAEAFKRLILDLDERGLGLEVMRAGDMLAAAYGRLEDREGPRGCCGSWPGQPHDLGHCTGEGEAGDVR